MRRGKECAQAAHASMKVLLDYKEDWPAKTEWLADSFAKICVRANSEEELLELYEKAIELGLHAALVTDVGRTEFNGVPTNTCIAIGPDYSEDVDKVTGNLKLL